jgi:hypothetical protein
MRRWEVAGAGLLMWLSLTNTRLRARAQVKDKPSRPIWPSIALTLFSNVPSIVAGNLLLAGVHGALYWIVPGVVVSLIAPLGRGRQPNAEPVLYGRV